ncbi:MAG: hypothetical protein ABII22_06160 [Candidatus Micrarchaeota archaeon]
MNSSYDLLERETWESLAHLALVFSVEFEKDDHQTRKIKKEVDILKRVIHGHLSTNSVSSQYLNAVFFVNLNKTIKKLEHAFEKNKVKRSDFLIFLKALTNKIRKEKLYVDKPFERVKEFGKLKFISENGHDFV